MTDNEALLLEYHHDMEKAQPLDRKPITQGYARILELRQEEAGVEGYKRGHIAADITEVFANLNGSGAHACYCPRSIDGGCTCALKDEYLAETANHNLNQEK